MDTVLAKWCYPLNLGHACRDQITDPSASVRRKNKVGKEGRLKGLMKSRETLETDLLRLTGIAWCASVNMELALDCRCMHGMSKDSLVSVHDTRSDRWWGANINVSVCCT